MAINLRSVTGELQQLLKVRAAQEKVTIESLCVRFLWWGLDANTHRDVPATGTEGERLAQKAVDILLEKRPNLTRPSHDPKTCRVRGCGLCAIAKEK
jgi:hypothetical protein